MKNNQIYWKTSSGSNAKRLINALNDKYIVIQLVERRPGKQRVTVVCQFDSGMQYQNDEALIKQCEWIDNNSIHDIYRFYVIQSI